jgi:hypothetical protein
MARLERAPDVLRDIARDIRDKHALSARILELIAGDIEAEIYGENEHSYVTVGE